MTATGNGGSLPAQCTLHPLRFCCNAVAKCAFTRPKPTGAYAMPTTSILRFGLILATALVLLAGVVASAMFLSRPQALPAAEELDKPVMATQIEFMADAMQRSAARIAAHPQTLACFTSAAPEVCQAQATNLHALNQDATVLFVTDGQRQ